MLEQLTTPVYEYSCWPSCKKKAGPVCIVPNPQCLLLPHCCLPVICKVSPECGIAKIVYKVIANIGDTHCFDNITAVELYDRWVNRQIALTADLLTGGLLSTFLPLVNGNIDQVAASGSPLPQNVKNLLNQIIEPVYNGGQTGYTYDDVNNIKIVNENKNYLTRFWMQKGAITLGPVIVLTDADYNNLMSAGNVTDLNGLLTAQRPAAFSDAMMVLLHEMVHVNQYAELGRETFTTNYLLKNAPLVTDGYGFCEFEQEAYKFAASTAERLGKNFCYDVSPTLNDFNQRFLSRGPLSCGPCTTRASAIKCGSTSDRCGGMVSQGRCKVGEECRSNVCKPKKSNGGSLCNETTCRGSCCSPPAVCHRECRGGGCVCIPD